jgi:hypothetical protein
VPFERDLLLPLLSCCRVTRWVVVRVARKPALQSCLTCSSHCNVFIEFSGNKVSLGTLPAAKLSTSLIQVGYLALRSESDTLPDQLVTLATDVAPYVRQLAYMIAGDWMESKDR